MARYDATATSLVDVSNILKQTACCVLVADNEDEGGSFLRNIRTYETTSYHIQVHNKFYVLLTVHPCIIL